MRAGGRARHDARSRSRLPHTCAPAAAASSSARLAPGRPYAMLSSIDALKSTVSWGTTPIAPRSDACVTSLVSWPSMSTRPAFAS